VCVCVCVCAGWSGKSGEGDEGGERHLPSVN